MTVQEAYMVLKDRLNNLSTNANQNLSERAFVFAFNKMQLHWVEERIKIAEANQVRQEEIQHLIKEFTNAGLRLDEALVFNLPDDYFRYNRVFGNCGNGECDQIVDAYPREEVNGGRLLRDEFQKPSFEWQETFFTLKNNKLYFHINDFDCEDITLIYYRCPKSISMEEVDLDGYRVNIDPELDKTSLEEVIDLTAQLLAGDTLNPRYQTLSNQIQQNN